MDILRAALGDAKLDLSLGKSYGTFLGATYVGSLSDRGSLRPRRSGRAPISPFEQFAVVGWPKGFDVATRVGPGLRRVWQMPWARTSTTP